ncbi:hypothetical protein L1887_24744 [Cichorium endivia]|nr:hypothetical protein L1887_24744 [Cichorium endivia]
MNSTVAPVSDSGGFLRSENNGRGAEGMQSPTNPTQPITWWTWHQETMKRKVMTYSVIQQQENHRDHENPLKVFTYKELHTATNGFLEQRCHGGFGAVFSGKVESTLEAVKRLERPGGGEIEFRRR